MCSVLYNHKYSFNNIIDEVNFVNSFVLSKCYYWIQILPFSNILWARINKIIGYFLWQSYPLRIKRQQLTLPYKEGGLQLKQPEIQGHALRLQRTLQVICEYYENFSYGLFQHVLSLIRLLAPVDMRQWKHLIPY